MDGLGFGFHGLGEPITLAEVHSLFSGILIGNVGYTQLAAEDMIVFDRPFIANPDWVERIRNSWHLPPEAAMDAWYSQQEAGYIDCPPIPDRAEAEHAMAPWV